MAGKDNERWYLWSTMWEKIPCQKDNGIGIPKESSQVNITQRVMRDEWV